MGEHELSAQARATTTASTTVAILAFISVALRFYTRRIIKAGYGPDDWWILGGLVLTLTTGGILLYGSYRPSGIYIDLFMKSTQVLEKTRMAAKSSIGTILTSNTIHTLPISRPHS